MKTNFSRFFALVMIVVLALCLAGCANDKKAEPTAAPVVEVTATEAPVVEDTATEAPAVEDTATEAPVVEDAATEAPVVEDTATEAPVVEVTATEAPVVEDAATEAPAVEDAATEAPVVEDAATEAPAVEDTATEAPVVEDAATEAPVVEAVKTYADYAAAPVDTPVEVETYVQAKQSWWDNKATFYTQNEEGAYFIYEMAISEEDYNKLIPGTKILVKGFKTEWSGEIEIVDATFEILEGEYIAQPQDLTDLIASEELINYQNQLAAFKGMTVDAIEYKNGEPGDDIYVTLSKDGAQYSFCVERYLTAPDTEVYQTVGTLNAGDVVDVEGFVYWYNGLNTHMTKVTVVEAAPAAEEVVAEEAPAAEEVVAEEAPAAEEVVAEEAPAAEEVVTEEAPAAEEVVAEEAPAAEEVVAEEAPAAEEVVAEEAPAAEEVVAEEAPAAEEVVTEEAPAAEEVVAEEAPAAEEVVAEEAPAAEEVVAEEAPVAEEVVVEEAPAAEEVVAEEAPVDDFVPAAVTTYADYAAAPVDTPVEVETYVQAKQSWWDNKATFYTQNEEGAYFIYEMAISEEDYNKLIPGTKILVKGFKAEWSGEVEIVDATFEILEGEFIAQPQDLTDLIASEELINYQNQLAAFKGMTVDAIEYKNGEPGDDIYVTLSKDGAQYSFCVERYLTAPDTEVYQTVGTLNVGDVVDVEGFVYWYNGLNTHMTKVTVVEAAPAAEEVVAEEAPAAEEVTETVEETPAE